MRAAGHLLPAAPAAPASTEPPPPFEVRLYCEDALSGLRRRVPRGGADVVVTSPPYNIGVPYGVYEDRRPRGEYLRWIGRVAHATARALAPRGSFFLNVGGPPKDPGLPWEIAGVVRRELVLQNVIHWVKSIAIEREAVGRGHGLARDLAVGHYKPVNSRRYLHGAHEYIFHFTHRGDVELDRLAVGVRYTDGSNVARWGSSRGGVRCRGNTWFLPYTTIRRRASDRPHPASFPPELPERCFRLHGLSRIRLAVDPFTGIGASPVAAARLGLPFLGFDIDRGYLVEAERRVRREIPENGTVSLLGGSARPPEETSPRAKTRL
ncbi:MAG TPA: site-specific DNA-methyltransferase [Thermoplasmata archaeon]|nr:site-specific DNA-methyltransferase [Thermoplasmata archaeon]